ncbi:uncharacterized protein N7511_001599 [Penicillium nucicola]|uniref:uncharacterized protein n=1 Tax=Penicillium nucicola TaxID=1850975 RepID=UPI0025454284|nr:uncharacterized protein N7511_001599 [Penicillium nucicola]KAJ5776588.1 hypothetical protein N7511_001599 [Penicillium nucicola]
MSVAKEFEAANVPYAASFTKGDLQLSPQRGDSMHGCPSRYLTSLPPLPSNAIAEPPNITADPAQALGLKEGDAHVIRNAGGRASDALRSVIISQQLLGTREIVLVHHTDCGMLTFTDTAIRGKIREELGSNGDHIAFLPFDDLRQSVLDDVKVLRDSPLVLDVPITGYLYEVETGRIVRIGDDS